MHPLDKWQYLTLDLLLAVVLMILVRYFSSLLNQVDPVEELTSRDNVAFGISLGGSIIAMMLIVAGAVSNQRTDDLGKDLLGVSIYSFIGLILIKFGLVVYDKIILSQLEKLDEIRFKNKSVAVVDAAASIGIALLINAFLSWAYKTQLMSLIAAFGGCIMGLVMLLCVTRVREYYYYRQSKGETLQEALVRDQMSSALRLASELIGVALLFGIVQSYVPYNEQQPLLSLMWLLIFGFGLISVFFILAAIIKRIVLQGIGYTHEVAYKYRIGVAVVEAAIHVGIAFFLRAMLS